MKIIIILSVIFLISCKGKEHVSIKLTKGNYKLVRPIDGKDSVILITRNDTQIYRQEGNLGCEMSNTSFYMGKSDDEKALMYLLSQAKGINKNIDHIYFRPFDPYYKSDSFQVRTLKPYRTVIHKK